MMKLFDLHGDTGYAVMKLRALHKQNIIADYQLGKRKQGGFQWLCAASYFEGHETWEDMQAMITALHEEITLCDDVSLINQKQQLKKPNTLNMILSVEGMCGIREQVEEKIDWLNAHDIKVGSLAWNDENALATGVRGNPKRGLSELGRRAIARMGVHGMVIDVSHANEKTFWDIMTCAKSPVIATHSNARALCDHPRNLYDEQLLAIAENGGLVGVVCAGAFVHRDRKLQSISQLVGHIKYLEQLIGMEHIALGCDFMDDYDNAQDTMLIDLNSPKDAQKIIDELRNQGFQEAEIRMLAYENAHRFFMQHLK